jgi:hypothetical protein
MAATVTIISRIASASGKAPTDLAIGELAVDPYLGKLWYKDVGNEHKALAQEVYIEISSIEPPASREGMFWYQKDIGQLVLRSNDAWLDIGLGRDGGLLNGHLKIQVPADGDVLFETMDVLPGTGDEGGIEAAPGVYTFGSLVAGGSIYSGDLLYAGGSIIGAGASNVLEGSLYVTGVTSLVAQTTTGAPIIRESAGAYFYNTAPGATSSAVTVSTSNPSGGNDGDLWFKVA